jgi:acetylcholinesterase
MLPIPWIFLCASVVTSQNIATKELHDDLVINTTSGAFAPYFAESHPDVAAFLDIPFGENPIGPLRFAAPVPARPRDSDASVIRATSLPAGCLQFVGSGLDGTVTTSGRRGWLLQYGDYANTTEDCLRLTIYAPKVSVQRAASLSSRSAERPPSYEQLDDDADDNDKEPHLLPVIIWLHGGGFSFGGNNVPYQIMQNWVQRSQELIVVQAQYRLNLLGLPNAEAMALPGPGASQNQSRNLALLDHRLAVEWVRDNIASVGGDPARITLWGHSAGAWADDAYPFAWRSDPIVAGVIADSGNAVSLGRFAPDGSDHTAFSTAAGSLGCGGAATPAEELDCMRAVPAADLKAYVQDGGAAADNVMFPVVADNITAFRNYSGLLLAGRSPGTPLLISSTTDEGGFAVPYDFEGSETTSELPPDLARVALSFRLNVQCRVLEEIRARAAANLTTYQYLYAGNFSNVSPRPWLGAYHFTEIPPIAGTYELEGPGSDFQRDLSIRMQDRYVAFASDPVNGLRNQGWPASTGAERSPVMEWAADGLVEQIIDADQLREECVNNGYEI